MNKVKNDNYDIDFDWDISDGKRESSPYSESTPTSSK